MGYRSVGHLAEFGVEEPMRAAQRRTADRVASLMRDRVVLHTPVAKPPVPEVFPDWLRSRHRTPGTLKASWRLGELRIEGDLVSVEVYTDDKIAPYVEWPTLPHIIVPKRAGMLRFYASATTPGAVAGQLIYAQIVHHTGTKGSYMLATTISEMTVEWEAVGAEEMERWAREQAAAVPA